MHQRRAGDDRRTGKSAPDKIYRPKGHYRHFAAPFGLTGFAGIPAGQRNQQAHLSEAIVSQLALLFSPAAAAPLKLFYQDWAREPFTATEYDQPPVITHPAYQPPAGQPTIWDGAIHFAGTEMADQHGGYLEGALGAAERAVFNF